MFRIITIITIASLFSNASQASLIGQDVTLTHQWPFIGNFIGGNTVTVVDGDADEVTFGKIDVNVEGESIIFTHNTNVAFAFGGATGEIASNLITAEDLVWSNMPSATISDVNIVTTFDPVVAGLDLLSDINFGSNWVSIDLQGQQWGIGQTLTMTFGHSTDPDPDPNPVPEPSIIALFALGLFGIGFARRRKA